MQVWLPNPKSAILISDFDSPRHLAEHLMYLNEDDSEYITYLDHKLKPFDDNASISNYELLKALNERQYTINTLIDKFECYCCSRTTHSTLTVANQLHYNCAKSPTFPKMDEFVTANAQTPSNYDSWKHRLIQAKCDADLVNWFVTKNRSFTTEEYNTELLERYNGGLCEI